MKKLLFFLIMVAEIPCSGNAYAKLVSIAQPTDTIPFKVTIQSSDKEVEVVLKSGETVGFTINPLEKNTNKGSFYILDELNKNLSEKRKNQGRVYTLDELKSFSFIIPWQGWDGDATIKVKVFKGNELIAEMHLQDRDRTMKFIGIKNAQTIDISKTRLAQIFGEHSSYTYKNIDCSFAVQLNISPSGYIWVPKPKLIDCDDADQRFRITE
jgi:hypothetical protein